MKKIYLSLIFFTLAFNSFSQCIQNASMYNYGRYAGVSFVLNGKAYVGLGQRFGGAQVYDFWEYNPQNNVWTRKADFPGQGAYSASSFVIDGTAYVCLGANSSTVPQRELWQYIPENDTWKRKADFPGAARYGASCFVIGSTAYIGTGSYNDGYNYLVDMWSYQPSTNTWTQIADCPGGKRNHATGFAFGGYGYIGGGLFDPQTAKTDFWRYDPKTNTWTRIPDMPGEARLSAVSFVYNKLVYVGTGYDFFHNYNTFYSYIPALNSWYAMYTPQNDVTPRRGAVSFVIGSKIYLATGLNEKGIISDMWSLDPFACDEQIIENSSETLNITPNPARSNTTIEFPGLEGEKTVCVFDISGNKVGEIKTTGDNIVLDTKDLASGIYILTLTAGNTELRRSRLLVE